MLFLIESALIALAIIGAFGFPRLGASAFAKLERPFASLARRRVKAVLAVGFLALTLRIALLPVEPVPEPVSHDEWAHLLAADTFAHWRLTNRTHPLWVHFESFSIMQQPTYQTYMQPGQAIVLAFGKIILGRPYWGVWLGCGLMCAAITWMLQAWLPARWALLGGLLALLRYGVFGYWANSYWGGAVGAIGGALVLGALPRIKRSQRTRDATVMAVGLGILANTRPYEGFVFSLPIAAVLLWWLFSKRAPGFRVSFRHILVPICISLAVIGTGMCYYFWRLTGSPLTMPYHLSQEGYVAPYMIWQSPRPAPAYHHYVFWKMCVEQAPQVFAMARTPAGFIWKALWWWPFFLGPVFTFAIIAALWLRVGTTRQEHTVFFGAIKRLCDWSCAGNIFLAALLSSEHGDSLVLSAPGNAAVATVASARALLRPLSQPRCITDLPDHVHASCLGCTTSHFSRRWSSAELESGNAEGFWA